jgi:transposase
MVEAFAADFAMELITILNQCHRFRGFVYHHDRFNPDKKVIEIGVRPRVGSAALCSGCHQPAPGYDHLPERRFEFIPFWGMLVFLLYRMRRVNCRDCGVVVEEVPWGDGKHQLTRAYMLFLARWARRLSWTETAEAFHTSWEKVCDAVEYVVAWGLEHRTLAPIRAIGVDEIQYAKGHKYLTLVYQIDAELTRLLWVGKERTVETFQGFFAMIGKDLTSKIEFGCSDMWKPYLRVIRETCSQALHILDRFHIVAKMNQALDDVRAAEARKLAQAGHEPLLKNSRWCVLKRRENLTSQQKFRLRDLLRYNLQTVRAYLLKEGLPAVLGLQLAYLGRHVPGLLVLPHHALPHRAHEEDRSNATRPPATSPQLLQSQKADFQRTRRGPEQQSQTHHEKIVWLSNLPHS